jgi:hypothetical protein
MTKLDVGAAQGFGPASLPAAPQPSGSSVKTQDEKDAAQITEQNNPADSHEQQMLRERGPRLSLNAPSRRLEVPPIPGYHMHWFLERNIPAALQGWYEYVDPKEVPTVDRSIGGRTAGSKSEDLGGARVSQIGGVNESGLPEQLVLMKIRQEWYFDEQRKIAERNLLIIKQIFHKKAPIMAPEESQADYSQRYTREAVIDMTAGRVRKAEPTSST